MTRHTSRRFTVYKTLIISTIVDYTPTPTGEKVYKTLIISTIVDISG